MLGNRELILIAIFIIGVVSIIIVELYYRKHEEANTDIKLFNKGPDGGFFARKTHKETNQIINHDSIDNSYENTSYYKTQNSIRQPDNQFRSQNRPNPYATNPIYNNPKSTYTQEGDMMSNIEKDEKIEKESPKEEELKDLFTIDELIKESKRKQNTTKTEEEKVEVPSFLSPEEKTEIENEIKKDETTPIEEDKLEDITPDEETVSFEDIKPEVESYETAISSPILKSPSKTEEEYSEPTITNDEDELLSETTIDDSELFEDEDYNELDYRKDLARITDKVKNSKIYNDVKNKLSTGTLEEDDPSRDEEFIRNVRAYDAPEGDYYTYEEAEYKPRTRKTQTAKDLHITEAPKIDRLEIKVNNTPAVLRKGDEIIYKYDGDTYSSKVFGIAGDDISVKFRGKAITIKPSDVKKIF